MLDRMASATALAIAGSKVASVTYSGGTISFFKNRDVKNASCTLTPGPALALCAKTSGL